MCKSRHRQLRRAKARHGCVGVLVEPMYQAIESRREGPSLSMRQTNIMASVKIMIAAHVHTTEQYLASTTEMG